jgi:hypothetical protein
MTMMIEKNAKNESSPTKRQLEDLMGSLEFWALVFGVIVVIGVAGESVFGIRIWWNGRKLQVAQNAEIEQLREGIAKADERAAEANARAAEANLALAKLKTPRTLTPEQREVITHAMRAYSGQVFVIYAAPDPEASELARMIKAALIDAQWNAGLPSSIHDEGIGLATGKGIEIEWAPSASEYIKKCGSALAAVLKEQGLVTTTGSDPRSRLFANVLSITVGTKPQ